jgi:hypothetical protein
MTDYDKAVELLGKFYHNVGSYQNKVQNAIILVDEIPILKLLYFITKNTVEKAIYWLKVMRSSNWLHNVLRGFVMLPTHTNI